MGAAPNESPRVHISTTKRMTVVGVTLLEVGWLREFIEGLPDDAKVTFRTAAPDRPGELPTVTVEVTAK